jgi:hypothetical protein
MGVGSAPAQVEINGVGGAGEPDHYAVRADAPLVGVAVQLEGGGPFPDPLVFQTLHHLLRLGHGLIPPGEHMQGPVLAPVVESRAIFTSVLSHDSS